MALSRLGGLWLTQAYVCISSDPKTLPRGKQCLDWPWMVTCPPLGQEEEWGLCQLNHMGWEQKRVVPNGSLGFLAREGTPERQKEYESTKEGLLLNRKKCLLSPQTRGEEGRAGAKVDNFEDADMTMSPSTLGFSTEVEAGACAERVGVEVSWETGGKELRFRRAAEGVGEGADSDKKIVTS